MVPNHTGMDSRWVVEKPDLFVQTRDCPFPGYDFNGENLSHDGRVGVYLENHYYSKTDCAVVFKRVDHATGDTRYIYHGNDGTGMPWNDTAQIDFLNPRAREEVIQKILHVARNFPIIRFDAAMVLAKKHIQRLWYPEPGRGGDIASRSQHSITREEFERRIPEEFWREVVDRCAAEIPDTLLLAEAFWMMEGYFVRTLGMHRVYNSAFMNMLKREDNAKYRTTIKNTIEFDPEILKRYVNFMNNPDEETAVAQFGKGDKYFGVCTMMVAMPGLPMFGHGQVEGFEEKYGMEYRKAYRDESADQDLVNRHRAEIFPLMKKRYLFAGAENFRLYDFFEDGRVDENVFAWSNRAGTERALILYNNAYRQTAGWIRLSAAYLEKNPDGTKTLRQRKLSEALALDSRENRYCIMQEQRSQLWFIRSTLALDTEGLYAQLDGFRTQAFVNIYEVDDNEWGHYRALHDALGGRGIDDVHMGIQNIFLKDLYASLTKLAAPAFFAGIAALRSLARSGRPELDEEEALWLSGLKPAFLNFVGQCEAFIGGAYGAQSLPGMTTRAKPTAAAAGAAWQTFTARLGRLIRLTAPVGSSTATADTVTAASAMAATNKADATAPVSATSTIAASGEPPEKPAATVAIGVAALEATPHAPEIIGGALILETLRDIAGTATPGETVAGLIQLWSLDRKLAAIMAESALDAATARADLRRLTGLLPLVDLAAAPAKHRLALAATKLVDSDDARFLLGLHEWDGTRWFNKELAERLTSLALLMAQLDGMAEATTTALSRDIAALVEKSAYRADYFASLCPPKPATSSATKRDTKASGAASEANGSKTTDSASKSSASKGGKPGAASAKAKP